VPLVRWFPQQPVPALFDVAQPPPVTVINEAMASRYWPDRSPIGQQFRVLFSPPVAVVGVVANTRSLSLTEPPVPEFYLHDLQEPQTVLSVLVRAEPPAAPSADAVRAAIWGLDPDLAIASARTLDELADHSLLVPRFTSILVGTFATAALALMAVGLYGLMAMTTAMRLPEIGVRLALGAGRGAVVALLVRHGLLLAIIGAAAGLRLGPHGARLVRGRAVRAHVGDPADGGAAPCRGDRRRGRGRARARRPAPPPRGMA
jgi:hypothetical protein